MVFLVLVAVSDVSEFRSSLVGFSDQLHPMLSPCTLSVTHPPATFMGDASLNRVWKVIS
jgi:hypothetical protein